jgi:hypothetical protein
LFYGIEKGTAKPESSSVQPGFEEEEDFHHYHLMRLRIIQAADLRK